MPHADPIERQRYNREYKRANRWRYQRRQKAYDAAKHANERARRSGSLGTITADEAGAVLATGRCHWCGKELDYFAAELDHVVPLVDRGRNDPSNIVAACEPCNAHKAERPHANRWSERHDCCVSCGTSDRPHLALGKCRRCYWRDYERAHRGRRR